MREIKFRAWDKENERMFEVDGLSFRNQYITDEAGQHSFKFNQCYLMQYTGLKDKNGKEIYEGDIVREDNPYTSFSSGLKVLFEQELLQFGVVEIDNYFTPLSDIKGYWEVIGNIYENPELLKREVK